MWICYKSGTICNAWVELRHDVPLIPATQVSHFFIYWIFIQLHKSVGWLYEFTWRNEMKWIGLWANWARRTWGWWGDWDRWHCPPDTGFEIRILAVSGRARYLSVPEAPHNTNFYTWMRKKHFCFFQTAKTGNRTPNSGEKRKLC